MVNCLYDKSTNELVAPEEDAVVMNAEDIDAEASRMFGDKDMIVVK